MRWFAIKGKEDGMWKSEKQENEGEQVGFMKPQRRQRSVHRRSLSLTDGHFHPSGLDVRDSRRQPEEFRDISPAKETEGFPIPTEGAED
jgi:hypothetical protein